MDWHLRIDRITGPGLKEAAAVGRVGRNSAWLLLSRVVTQVQLLLLTVLLARTLGKFGFGQYSLIASLVLLANVLTTFGSDTIIIRSVAGARRADIPEVSAALHLQLALSTLAIAAIWVWTGAFTGQSAGVISALRLYSLSLWPLAFFSVFSAVLRGFERMDLYLAISLGMAGLQILSVWLLLRSGGDLPGLMAVLLSIQIFGMLFSFILCQAAVPFFNPPWKPNLLTTLNLLHTAWPLAVLSIGGVAYQRLGIYTLSYWGSSGQTGLFSAAAKAVEALKIGQIAILGALLPALTRLQGNAGSGKLEKVLAARISRLATAGLTAIGLLGAAALTIFASPLVSGLFGPDFSEAVPVLRMLSWILLPYSLSASLAVEMIAKGREKPVTFALLAGLGSALALSTVLVPGYGALGAGLAAVFGECIQAGGLCYFRNKS